MASPHLWIKFFPDSISENRLLMGENARNRTVVTGILLLYHKIMKKKTLFSKRCKFFHVNCRQKFINFCGSFCAFLQKSEKLKKIFGICNFFYSRIVSIVKGFFAAFAVQTVVCSSVFPLSREKGRCEGGLHCAVRGTHPERTGREHWFWDGRKQKHTCWT